MTTTSVFADLLDRALTERGMTLERVVEHIARQGARCSVSTLSLWRRGRTRPSLARSAPVLEALEQVLQLPERALREALAQPDAGAPEWWASRVPVDEVADVREAYRLFREQTDLEDSEDLERLRTHVRLELGPGRTVARTVVSMVLRARSAGTHRLGVYRGTREETADGQPAAFELDALLGGHVADRVDFPHLGASAVLVELDQPMTEGEVAPLELVWRRMTEAPPPQGSMHYQMRHPWPVGHLSIEACFQPDDMPTSVHGVAVARLAPEDQLVDQPHVDLPPGACVELSVDHVLGGGVRLEWTWDEDA